MSTFVPALAGGVTGLRAMARTEVMSGLRRARRITSEPTSPVAPVTMSFILMVQCSFSQKLGDGVEGKAGKVVDWH